MYQTMKWSPLALERIELRLTDKGRSRCFSITYYPTTGEILEVVIDYSISLFCFFLAFAAAATDPPRGSENTTSCGLSSA